MVNPLDTSPFLSDCIDDANKHLDALDEALLEIERDSEVAGLDHNIIS